MPRTKGTPHVALAIAAALAGIAAFASCSTDDTSAPAADAGPDDALDAARAACPKEEPGSGAACDLPEGTTCDFGACGTRLTVCSGGAWRRAGNPPPTPPCPDAPPTSDAGCPPCWPVAKTCTYYSAACLDPDAAGPLNAAVASCPSGIWSVDIQSCPPPEAGADVQGDSGLDGD